MKVAVVDAVSDVYGSSRICRLIVDMLREGGHDVETYVREEALPPGDRYARQLDFPLLVMSRLRRSPGAFLLDLVVASARFWRTSGRVFRDADVVYCNTFGTLPVALMSRLRGKRTVLHLHETAPSVAIAAVGRALMSAAASQIVCVSAAVARSWGIERDRSTRIVHNGLPDVPGERPESPGFDVAFVGRLTEKKGIGVFLDALELLDGEGERLRAVIVGGPVPGEAPPARLTTLERHRGLSVSYLGELPEATGVLLNTKVACIPSTFADPFPTVVLEALRAGCAVVATDLGGAREALEGAVAALVPPGDARALAEAMRSQLRGWDAARTSRVNRGIFHERFTLEAFKERFLTVETVRPTSASRAPAEGEG